VTAVRVSSPCRLRDLDGVRVYVSCKVPLMFELS
jgi:hypothetical protein